MTDSEVLRFFRQVKEVKSRTQPKKSLEGLLQLGQVAPVVGLFFMEPSTRTRLSFEVAARRLGIGSVLLSDLASSSISKGESGADTFLNFKAMGLDLFVVRHPEDPELAEVLRASEVPVINAGQGAIGHPTQGLLDVFTAYEHFGDVKGLKVLFVGDIKYGRAAHSSMELFSRLGGEIGVLSPPSMAYEGSLEVQRFTSLAEASGWADIVVGLRIQKERHVKSLDFSAGDYIRSFRLDAENLSGLKSQGLIMHPGPFVPEVDFSSILLKDPRCRVHQQVENGVYVRMVLMGHILNLWSKEFIQ